jgi:PKD repeat protein
VNKSTGAAIAGLTAAGGLAIWYLMTRKQVGPTFPEARFDFHPRTAHAPAIIQFTDLSRSEPPILSWEWDFGDGATSTDQHPVHEYINSGAYIVTLTVVNQNGADTEQLIIAITEPLPPRPPIAAFSYEKTTGTGEVHFYDESYSDVPISKRLWEFGDGGASIEGNPVWTYTQPGTYTVTLTVTSIAGSDTAQKTLNINIPEPVPTAEFSWVAAQDGSGVVAFQDESQSELPIQSWVWHFGDGQSSEAPDPTHTYDESGQYVVALTVDNGYATDIVQHTVSVTVTPELPELPQAAFTYQPASGLAPLTVYFQDTSISEDPITSRQWTFGDGSTSTSAAPSHQYNQSGDYTVTLTVSNSAGSDSVSHVVQVLPPEAPEGARGQILNIVKENQPQNQQIKVTITFRNIGDETGEYFDAGLAIGKGSTPQNFVVSSETITGCGYCAPGQQITVFDYVKYSGLPSGTYSFRIILGVYWDAGNEWVRVDEHIVHANILVI